MFSIFISWEMLIIGLMVYTIPVFINRKLYSRMKEVGLLKISSNEKVIGLFTDMLNGMKRIKIDALEVFFKEKSKNILHQSQQWRILKRNTTSIITIVTQGLSIFSLLSIIYFGISIFHIDISSLFLLFIIFTRLKSSTDMLSDKFIKIREWYPQVDRYYSLLKSLDFDKTINDLGEVVENITIQSIDIKDIDFSYRDDVVIDKLNFSAKSGDRILIQGESGIGKSTILDILYGLISPDNGEIKYNGDKINRSDFYKIRKNAIMISPDLYLFDTSVKDNLSMGSSLKKSDIDFTLKKALAYEFVYQNPQKLDMRIGADGELLSLGQRHRLIIARLFLQKSKLILLDEATANLDTDLEERIIQNILEYIDSDSILIMVAHKEPRNINFTNKYLMKNGNLISN